MNTNLKLLQNKIKIDTVILWVVCILFSLSILSYADKVIQYSRMSGSSFEVRLAPTDTPNNTDNYYLFIDGEQYYPINYNNYSRLDDAGNLNVKANVIMDNVAGVVRGILIEIIFCLLYKMLLQVKKGLTPFSRYSVSILKKVAIFSFLLGLLPKAIDIMESVMVFGYVTIDFSVLNFYILSIGVIFGILSEIFKFGCDLQDDVNQII